MAMLFKILQPLQTADLCQRCLQISGKSLSVALQGLSTQAQASEQAQGSTHISPHAPDKPSTSGRNSHENVKPELVDQLLSAVNMNHKQRVKLEKQSLVQKLQRHASDSGSPEVSVAVWTHWIREQVKQFYLHPKNPMVMREFEIILHKRRRLLAYLRDANFSAYAACIRQLGLADVFGRTTSADRYPIGRAHEDKEEGGSDHIRRRRFAFHRQYWVKKTSQWKRLLPELQAQDPNLPKPPAQMIQGSVGRLVPEEQPK